MNKIVALWAVPRSTSTAFEWMMRQRGVSTVFMNPFGRHGIRVKSRYGAPDRDSLRTPGLTLESVWASMLDMAAKGPVFSKDFPHYIDHIWNDEMLYISPIPSSSETLL